MSGARLYSPEEVTHQAYDIFLQLAPEHLSSADIDDFNQHREQWGFIEEGEPEDFWHDLVALEIEAEYFSQVFIGLELENADIIFAQVLISRDMDAPFCHILWKK